MAQILPGADDRALAPLIHLEAGRPASGIRRLAALGGDGLQEALRLSKAKTSHLKAIREAATGTAGAGELGYRLGTEKALDALLLRAALLEQPIPPDLETEIALGAEAVFPVMARDLLPDLQGLAAGRGGKKTGSGLDRVRVHAQPRRAAELFPLTRGVSSVTTFGGDKTANLAYPWGSHHMTEEC